MTKAFYAGMFLTFFMSTVCFADVSLPVGWSADFNDPSPANSSCVGCTIKAGKNLTEAPFILDNGRVGLNVDLTTVSVVNNLLLKIHFSSVNPFSPADVYGIQEKVADGKKSLMFKLSGSQIVFPTSLNELKNSPVVSSSSPEYSIRKINGGLVVADENNVYLFSLDNKSNWILTEIQKRGCPGRNLRCVYNADGQLVALVLPDGQKYELTYRDNRVVSVKDPAGAQTKIDWVNNRIAVLSTILLPEHPFHSKENDSLNTVRNIAVKYDAVSKIENVVNSSGETIRAEYRNDRKNGELVNLTVLTNPDGSSEFMKIIHGKNGTILTTETGFVGKSEKFGVTTYFPDEIIRKEKIGTSGYRTISKTINGNEIKYSYNEKEQKISETDGLGRVTKFEYDTNGRKVAEIYPDGSRQTLKYDQNGRIEDTAREDGLVLKDIWKDDRLTDRFKGDLLTSYEYDKDGKPIRTILPGGERYSFEWDNLYRLASMTRPDGVKTIFRYAGPLEDIIAKDIVSPTEKERYSRTFAYDPKGRVTQINYPDGTSEKFEYSCCDLIGRSDRAGAATRYVYDAGHRKVMEIFPNGDKTSYAYNNRGQTLKIVYPDETTLLHEYDRYGRLVKSTQRDGIWTSFSYDAAGRKVAMEKSTGTKSQYAYDDRNRLIAVTGTAERNRKYIYDHLGQLFEEQNFGLPEATSPRVTQYEYDKFGRNTKIIDSDGSEQSTAYSYDGRLEYTCERNIITHYVYDPIGRIISAARIPARRYFAAKTQAEKNDLHAKYKEESRTYDAFGNLFELREKSGRLLARYHYTPDGELNSILRPVSSSMAEKETYAYTYTDDGIKESTVFSMYIEWGLNTPIPHDYKENLAINAEQVKSSGRLLSQQAEKSGLLLWRKDALGNKIEYSYENGELCSISRNGERLAIYEYDKYGRLKNQSDVLGRNISSQYDKYGNIAETIQPDGSIAKTIYDEFGNLIERSGAGAYPLKYQYGSFGELLSYTDGNGATTRFEYDNMNRVTKRIWPDGSEISYRYDKNGFIVEKKEKSRVTEYRHNELGRIIGVKINNGSEIFLTSYVYNTYGQIISVQDNNSKTEFNYDEFGRTIEEKTNNGTINYYFDNKGRINKKVAKFVGSKEEFSTIYLYDNYNRVASVGSTTGMHNYSYDELGRISSIQGPGYQIKHTYDSANRLIAKSLNGKIYCSYTYDSFDRPVRETVNGEQRFYRYDQYGQLVSIKENDKIAFSSSFDLIGNRLIAQENETKYTYQSDKLNQYINITLAGESYDVAYDSYGNMIKNGKWIYTWDLQNRLIKAENGIIIAEYKYDHASRRIERKIIENAKVKTHEKFIFDKFNMIVKMDILSGVCQAFKWNNRDLLGVTDSKGNSFSYVNDAGRNTIYLISKNSEIDSIYSCSKYGIKNIMGNYGHSNPFIFSSEQSDYDTELIYYNFRYYSQKIGRWLSHDPIKEVGGYNLFSFLSNRMYQTDQLGLAGDVTHGIRKCYSTDSCAVLVSKISSINASLQARRAEMAKYVSIGQTQESYVGHKMQIDQQVTMLSNCIAYYVGHNPPCCGDPPSGYDPYPLPTWTPLKDQGISPELRNTLILTGIAIIAFDIITIPSGEGLLAIPIFAKAFGF